MLQSGAGFRPSTVLQAPSTNSSHGKYVRIGIESRSFLVQVEYAKYTLVALARKSGISLKCKVRFGSCSSKVTTVHDILACDLQAFSGNKSNDYTHMLQAPIFGQISHCQVRSRFLSGPIVLRGSKHQNLYSCLQTTLLARKF